MFAVRATVHHNYLGMQMVALQCVLCFVRLESNLTQLCFIGRQSQKCYNEMASRSDRGDGVVEWRVQRGQL
jgi:hypothetical protein